MGIGEWAALGAALMWAAASMLWSRIPLSAFAMNLFKSLFGCVVVLLLILLVPSGSGKPVFSADGRAWLWLGASGLVGIFLGDTVYFRSIQILGPRRALMLASTAPLFAALFGWMLAAENVSGRGMLGLTLAVTGVIAVVAGRQSGEVGPLPFPGLTRHGIGLGVLAAVCQALGGAMSRLGMENCGPLEATWIRLVVALAAILMVAAWRRETVPLWKGIGTPANLKLLVPAATMGTCLGITLYQIAFKHSPTATVTTLTATSPLFAIPLVWLVFGQPTSRQSVYWTLLAILGIHLLVTGTG